MTSVVQSATSDAYVREDNTTYKNPNSTRLTLTAAGGGDERQSFLYFNRPFPLGVTILSAVLRLFQQGAAAGGARTLSAKRVAAKWTESTIDWANKPSTTGSSEASASQGNGGTDGRVWEIDVTSLMQQVAGTSPADAAPWYGLRVTSSNDTILYVFSSEADDFQPQLEIEWSDKPAAPTVLSPSNGRAVSIARPTLRTDFADISGDTSLQYVHVQMNQDAPDSVSPTVDTGNVPAAVPEWLVNFDIGAGETWFWRGEVIDGAGLESGFSDWVSFTRTAKPAVSIDSPAGSVTEPTPPILWTVTGGTQTAYQVFITDPADASEVLWTSGKVTTADDSTSIPDLPTPLLTPGSEYGLTLRIWDDVVRESTPGDPIYTDTSTTFTFDLSTDVDPVTGLTVTVSDGTPDALVEWISATAPDSFTVVLDGVTYQSNVNPGDVLDAGTSYSMRLVAAPRVEHELSILRVVNGETSDDNPTEAFTTSPKGVWISTPDGLHKVSIANEPGRDGSPITFSPSELSVVRKPLGAVNPVLITQAVYGAEGSCKGTLKPFGSESLADVLATWQTMTDGATYPRGTPLNFVVTNKVFKAVPYNLVESEQDEFGNWSPVEFDFFEVR